jgi:hypothetical protein
MIDPGTFSKVEFEIKNLSRGNMSRRPRIREMSTLRVAENAGVLVSPLA